METKNLIIGGLLIAVVVAVVLYYKKEFPSEEAVDNKTCFELPASQDPAVFGSKYWAAFHALAADVPCLKCRTFAEKFITFFHDSVNAKISHKIYDQANYDYFVQSFAKVNMGMNFNDAFGLSK